MEISNESSVAKRQRMETQNAAQIFQEPMCLEISCQKLRMDLQEQYRVNQNLRAQLATKDKRIQELEQKTLENKKFETQGHQHIAENIFLHMDFEDLVAL